MQRLDAVGFKSDKGESTTPACVLVPHYSDIDNFTKLGEIIFNIDL